MNAHRERLIGTLRRKVLDHLLILNEAHARRVLGTYACHYNNHRPHRARQQRPPLDDDQAVPRTNVTELAEGALGDLGAGGEALGLVVVGDVVLGGGSDAVVPVTERHRRTVAHPSFTEILPGPLSRVRGQPR
ncbi:integrase core domain-containing protein [Streptomyces sp. OE57]|uniref:integrase core domain-containing protein n=1 Tax=Streptomyces lacaronensis TaxID=3379885 RepID=UPI0039B76039